ERKMQERQEYLDRYFVFSETSDYKPPKDWSRTNGLVEDIRQAYARVEERRSLALEARPLASHPPQAPLELPQRMAPSGAAPPAPAAPTPTAPRPARPAPAAPPPRPPPGNASPR
ncbi:MAG: type II secretion system protein GspD, partial [Labilithrix sp.]|nr:type II secretion system protein GspD [Labilithrix sp.]